MLGHFHLPMISKLFKTLSFVLFIGSTALSHAEESKPTDDSIRELLKAADAQNLVEAIINQVNGTMEAAMQKMASHASSQAFQKSLEKSRARTTSIIKEELSWDKLEPMYIRAYQASFTQDEIDGIAAFYKTPAGKALVKKMPLVMQNTMAEMQTMMTSMVPKLQKMQEELQAEAKSDEKGEDTSG